MKYVFYALLVLLSDRGAEAASNLSGGPLLGHLTPNSAVVWVRASKPGPVTIVAECDDHIVKATATASADKDFCLHLELKDLRPGLLYRYRVLGKDELVLSSGADHRICTPTPCSVSSKAVTRLAFGSCADEKEATQRVWRQMARERLDALVLLGDTPYIDRTELGYQRRRYLEFAQAPAFAQLVRSVSCYGTWDDHDFGRNDTDGRIGGKECARRAFTEYRANPSYGDGENGIYTRFRRGSFEVFLLDTRYFAATEPSPFLTHAASLLGRAQWDWLREGLKASTAPNKLICSGMIWNGSVRPGKRDHWGSYSYERDALFEFIGKHEISGVTLVGGDIHRSRVVRHSSQAAAGYDVIELITSPLHHRIIESANQPHPGLIKDLGTPHTFLVVSDDPDQSGRVRAEFVDVSGERIFELDLAR